MRPPRTLIIAAMIALTALAAVGFGTPNGLREDAAAPQTIALAAVTADATPLSQHLLSLGPIPCPDGSTVDFGQFCPLPTIQCANGTTVPIGSFCPQAAPAAQQPTPPPQATPPQQQQPSVTYGRGCGGVTPDPGCEAVRITTQPSTGQKIYECPDPGYTFDPGDGRCWNTPIR